MGPSAGWFEGVSPVAACRVVVVFAEDFAGVKVGDGGGGFVGDDEDAFAAVGCADSEVVHASCAAEAGVSVGIDVVVAKSVLVRGFPGPGKSFWRRRVGV